MTHTRNHYISLRSATNCMITKQRNDKEKLASNARETRQHEKINRNKYLHKNIYQLCNRTRTHNHTNTNIVRQWLVFLPRTHKNECFFLSLAISIRDSERSRFIETKITKHRIEWTQKQKSKWKEKIAQKKNPRKSASVIIIQFKIGFAKIRVA